MPSIPRTTILVLALLSLVVVLPAAAALEEPPPEQAATGDLETLLEPAACQADATTVSPPTTDTMEGLFDAEPRAWCCECGSCCYNSTCWMGGCLFLALCPYDI